MNIGIAAERSGIPPKTIRYYESIGLLTSAERAANGYRDYHDADVHTLRFVRRARRLGFTVLEVAKLLGLWRDRARTSAEVEMFAIECLAEIDHKLHELEELKRMLVDLAERCLNDERPDYPLMKEFADREPN